MVVAEAITGKRLARIPTGPVAALCFVPTHNKLYVAKANCDTIAVVDCAENRIVSIISVVGEAPALQYNPANDRLYCGGNSISVVDCAADTVMHTIALAATFYALDSTHNMLFAGRGGPLSVIDCAADSVIATIPGIRAAAVLCFNPTAGKVYAVSDDTLYAVQTGGDSIVARLPFAGLAPVLDCDPQRNRIYCAYSARWASIDCAADTVVLTHGTSWTPYFLACNVARDRLYVFRDCTDGVTVYDATTGQVLTLVRLDGVPVGGGWSPGLDRLYCLPSEWCSLLSAVDGAGDSIAGIVPLTMVANNISLDTVHNRLYFMYASSGSGCIGAADCSRNVVTSYTFAGGNSMAMCYNPNNDRLYWRTGNSMTVYDCSTNTVIGNVKTSGRVYATQLHPSLNKLYVGAEDTLGQSVLDIVDCESDSVVRVIALPSGVRLLLVPEDNVLWCLGSNHVIAIDCLGDSITADVVNNLGSHDDVCACPEDRKIYTSDGDVIDMDNPGHVDTIQFWGNRFCYVPGENKLHAVTNDYHPYFLVLDTRSDTVTTRFSSPCQVSGMCLDHTGEYIYCAGYEDTRMLVISVRADSVIAEFDVPITAAARDPLAVNRQTNRIYEAEYWGTPAGRIPVVHDSMLLGLEELKSTGHVSVIGPTVVSRNAPLRASSPTELYDASGRKVAPLQQGLNDICHLAPGVYFVHGERPRAQAQAVRKIVVTR